MDPDPILLELFNNHFAAIAEQMGAVLERTALSTNVKDRLDFSCAVYDDRGELVSHAQHIPVHLGAMGQCVKCFIEDAAHDPRLNPSPGDVFVTNDPYRGGSHLPDVTVITPVFHPDGDGILFYVANRAHHAEIGGRLPGSMAPCSRNLAEEGVLIRTTRLVAAASAPYHSEHEALASATATASVHSEHEALASEPAESAHQSGIFMPVFQEAALRQILSEAPYPSRAIDQNLADLRAQAAANQCGVQLLSDLTRRHGLDLVRAYMRHIQTAAETKMRSALRRLPPGTRRFADALDDGMTIAVTLTIKDDQATVDFTGTGPVHPGNLNATPAIVASAVLYCFRCLIDEDIPLNAGILAPIRMIVPPGILHPPAHPDPRQCPAVAGGNVETSQRIVDVIFGALGVVAASQGTMNNLTFGNDRFGYYETIGGGSGAGPTFDGASCVHTHMTNTRLTDPEVLEARYPIRLRRFAIRRGSGGSGRHRGGDGIIRAIEFLESLDVSLLTQRRTTQPYGLAGGGNGQPGRNLLHRPGAAQPEALHPLTDFHANSGDVLTLETPGGGGYGAVP